MKTVWTVGTGIEDWTAASRIVAEGPSATSEPAVVPLGLRAWTCGANIILSSAMFRKKICFIGRSQASHVCLFDKSALEYRDEPGTWSWRGKLKYLEENLFRCHFVYYKSNMDCPGIEAGRPRWEADDFTATTKLNGYLNI